MQNTYVSATSMHVCTYVCVCMCGYLPIHFRYDSCCDTSAKAPSLHRCHKLILDSCLFPWQNEWFLVASVVVVVAVFVVASCMIGCGLFVRYDCKCKRPAINWKFNRKLTYNGIASGHIIHTHTRPHISTHICVNTYFSAYLCSYAFMNAHMYGSSFKYGCKCGVLATYPIARTLTYALRYKTAKQILGGMQ